MAYIPTDEDVNIMVSYILNELETRWELDKEDYAKCFRLDPSLSTSQMLDIDLVEHYHSLGEKIDNADELDQVNINPSILASRCHKKTAEDAINCFSSPIEADVETLDLFRMFETHPETLAVFFAKLHIRLFPYTEQQKTTWSIKGLILKSFYTTLQKYILQQ